LIRRVQYVAARHATGARLGRSSVRHPVRYDSDFSARLADHERVSLYLCNDSRTDRHR
jgi:hypothetical protein